MQVGVDNRSGNNGQIQLWQFLLEILTDKNYINIIEWVGDEGEFKLSDPEVVAQVKSFKNIKTEYNFLIIFFFSSTSFGASERTNQQ